MNLFPVPLPVPRRNHYALLGVGPEATADEIRNAHGRYTRKRQAEGADDTEIEEINNIKLDKPDWRADYDAENPPCALLRILPTWSSLFEDRAHGLAALRRDVEDFLLRRGAEVYHPSDVTRTDFSGDFFSPSPLAEPFPEDPS